MVAIFHRPKYKLANKLRQPGGKTIAEAADAARTNLVGLRESADRAAEEVLGRINAAWAQWPSSKDLSALQALYHETNRLIGLSTVTGLKDMDTAAYSLCDVLDKMAAAGRWDSDAIQVHVQALNLLRRVERLNPDAVREILHGLGRVREKYVVASNIQ